MSKFVTTDEYQKLRLQLHHKHREEEMQLNIDVSKANNTIKLYDIIEDNIGKINVGSIMYGYVSLDSIPMCYYVGRVLKKDGTPTKKHEVRTVYQCNLDK